MRADTGGDDEYPKPFFTLFPPNVRVMVAAAILIGCVPCAKLFSKHFICTESHSHHNSDRKKLLPPFYCWENWGTEKLDTVVPWRASGDWWCIFAPHNATSTRFDEFWSPQGLRFDCNLSKVMQVDTWQNWDFKNPNEEHWSPGF